MDLGSLRLDNGHKQSHSLPAHLIRRFSESRPSIRNRLRDNVSMRCIPRVFCQDPTPLCDRYRHGFAVVWGTSLHILLQKCTTNDQPRGSASALVVIAAPHPNPNEVALKVQVSPTPSRSTHQSLVPGDREAGEVSRIHFEFLVEAQCCQLRRVRVIHTHQSLLFPLQVLAVEFRELG
jgi:hypothetical protein